MFNIADDTTPQYSSYTVFVHLNARGRMYFQSMISFHVSGDPLSLMHVHTVGC